MSVSQPAAPWPHAPTHQLSENGTYFVTAGTYLKAHHFRTPQRIYRFKTDALSVSDDFVPVVE
jgi:putative transposase